MLPAIPSGAGGVQNCTSEGFTHFSSRFCREKLCPWKVSPGAPPSPRNAPLCSLTPIRPSGCSVRFPRLSLWVVVLAKTSVTARLILIYFTKLTIAAFQMTLPSFFYQLSASPLRALQLLTAACLSRAQGDSPLAGSSLLTFSASGAGRDILQHCICPEMYVIQNAKHLRLCQFQTFRAEFMLRE